MSTQRSDDIAEDVAEREQHEEDAEETHGDGVHRDGRLGAVVARAVAEVRALGAPQRPPSEAQQHCRGQQRLLRRVELCRYVRHIHHQAQDHRPFAAHAPGGNMNTITDMVVQQVPLR